MVNKGVDGPRVGSGLGIDSLSWKLLFLIIYQQGKIGFRKFWATTPSRCRTGRPPRSQALSSTPPPGGDVHETRRSPLKEKKSNLQQIIEAVISVRIANITPAPQASMNPFCSRTRSNPVATLLSTHSIWLIQPAISCCIHSSAALLRAHCQLVGLECPVPRWSEWPPISPTC